MVVTVCLSLFLLLSFTINPVIGIKFNNIQIENQDLESDLEIKKSGGNWENNLVSAEVGTKLEFKITVDTSKDYILIGILVKLPSVGNTPMFNYDWILGVGSSNPKPIFPIGDWTANNTDVCWAWYIVDESWSKEMTFEATIMKSATKSIDLKVYALKNVNGDYDEFFDSVTVKSEKTRSFSFLNNALNSLKRLMGYSINHIFIELQDAGLETLQ